ncbi:DNA-directed primase/polymerase protein [Schistosoma japonicum]|uniref:DNA-directed primase/polymerase protein n=1 Tax=Schistosoma japonicum TaxID=6182 RepID=A0A4Z2D111_SCHJA|nr:DNA-directed primase/polymerase protein [Schistosoma japonicum]
MGEVLFILSLYTKFTLSLVPMDLVYLDVVNELVSLWQDLAEHRLNQMNNTTLSSTDGLFKRRDLEAAAARVRQIPQPYRASLRGPTSVRKIFRKQEDAINFAKKFGQEMMVFSYESLSLGNDGQRLFLACGIQSFFYTYKQMEPSSRCHYEVIIEDRPAKLYLDLEFCKLSNENKDGEKAVDTFLKALCGCIQFFYGITIKSSEIFILDASTAKKFSQHVIINNKNLIFQNNLEQAKYCFALPTLKQSTISNEFWISICDLGVYTRNRNFRLANSCKLSGSGLLLPKYIMNKNELFSKIWLNWQSWANTLVTYIDGECSNLIQRPVKDCCCGNNNSNLSLDYSFTDNDIINSNKHSFINDNNIQVIQSIPSNLNTFIENIIHEWFNRELSSKTINNELFNVKNQNRTISFYKGKLCVKVDRLRFCERINRSHKSNHVILVFDLINGCYYQKCLDPDCRLVDFRSPSMPIPVDYLNIPSVYNREDHVMNENNSAEDGYFSTDITPEDLMLSSILDDLQN